MMKKQLTQLLFPKVMKDDAFIPSVTFPLKYNMGV